MKKKTFIRAYRLWLVALAVPLLLGFAGCGDSDSGEGEKTVIRVSEIQRQLGFDIDDATGQVTSPTDDEGNEAVTVSRSIVIGAIVVRSRTFAQGPYNDQVPITNIEDQLEDDIRDSATFIVLLNLPTAEETVTIELPPPSASKWQLMGTSMSTQPASKAELGDDVNQDATIYIGFDNRFLLTDTEGLVFQADSSGNPSGGAIETLNLNLRRACLINKANPPKGCAQFQDNGNITVSAAVEIIGVEINGETRTLPNDVSYPIIVRDSPGSGQLNSTDAASLLFGLFLPLTTDAGRSVEVFTTHQLSPGQSAACQAATSVADLETHCGVESFFTPS